MPRYRELAGRQRFRCADCGRRKYVKYVPNGTLCRSCAAKRRRSVPNVLVTLTEDLVVTRAVERRLTKSAEADVPRSRAERVGDVVERVGFPMFWLAAGLMAWGLFGELIGIMWFAFLGAGFLFVGLLAIEKILAKPRKERREHVTARVIEMANARKQRLEEQERFYSSPEWAALRKQVVEEEGRVCAECRKRISYDNDITVDHKYPRSRYPHLALRRENLRVLCRQCNSQKGDREWLEA